jgi:molybdopterin/thiamine biosynthesis adenylyltransferase
MNRRPLLYIYLEDQLHDLLNATHQNATFSLSAFHFKGEGIYHIFSRKPELPHSGSPCLAFSHSCSTDEEFDQMVALDMHWPPEVNRDQFSSMLRIVFKTNNMGELVTSASILNQEGTSTNDVEVRYINGSSEVFARNNGIIENLMLEGKKIAVFGVGSFGSVVSLELAKSGVGAFTLVDFDTVEVSNIARHCAGLYDIGRFKTRVMSDLIRLKNPGCLVKTYEFDVTQNQRLLEEIVSESDLCICTTDNNLSRYLINQVGLHFSKTVIFGRAITRAEGGDVFILRGAGCPCYACLINDTGTGLGGADEISNIRQATTLLPAYTLPEDLEASVQVGMCCDIAPLCNFIVKIALLELSRNLCSISASLSEELTYNYYFFANRRERAYSSFAPFNAPGHGSPSILRWYGAEIPPFDSRCLICNH